MSQGLAHHRTARARRCRRRVANGATGGFSGGESACTPDSVPHLAVWRWPSLSAGRYRTALAAYPGVIRRATLSLLGLAPGGVYLAARVTPDAGALLPHRFTLTCAPSSKRQCHRRFALCCTFLRVASTGSYPAPCPSESGRSSNGSSPHAATQPTRHRQPFKHRHLSYVVPFVRKLGGHHNGRTSGD